MTRGAALTRQFADLAKITRLVGTFALLERVRLNPLR